MSEEFKQALESWNAFVDGMRACPHCGSRLAPGAPEQEGRASSFWCFKCDLRFVLPTNYRLVIE